MGRQPYHSRAGFTLVELLVVVSIIALLVAILLPSPGKSRKQARAAVCGAHLHQLGIATEMYVVENGCFPPHKTSLDGGDAARWPFATAGYVGSAELQICPSVSDWKIGRDNPYGYNYKYLGCMRRNADSPTAPYERFPVRSVPSPTMTIAYSDSDGTGWTKPYDPTRRDPEALGHHAYTLDPTYVPLIGLTTVNGEGEQEAYSYKSSRTYISPRHNGESNAVFADGHVQRINPKQVYQDNRYWNGLGREIPLLDPHVGVRVETGAFRYENELD